VPNVIKEKKQYLDSIMTKLIYLIKNQLKAKNLRQFNIYLRILQFISI